MKGDEKPLLLELLAAEVPRPPALRPSGPPTPHQTTMTLMETTALSSAFDPPLLLAADTTAEQVHHHLAKRTVWPGADTEGIANALVNPDTFLNFLANGFTVNFFRGMSHVVAGEFHRQIDHVVIKKKNSDQPTHANSRDLLLDPPVNERAGPREPGERGRAQQPAAAGRQRLRQPVRLHLPADREVRRPDALLRLPPVVRGAQGQDVSGNTKLYKGGREGGRDGRGFFCTLECKEEEYTTILIGCTIVNNYAQNCKLQWTYEIIRVVQSQQSAVYIEVFFC